MVKKSPTVLPAANFNADGDAEALKKAFKGFGSDEDAIIEIITKRTNDQRLLIANRFKTMYGKDLIKELKSELRGNFEDVIVALMTEPIEFQAKQLHKAISGIGTDEASLVEILSIHDNDEVQQITAKYEELYQTNLESDIKSDTSGTLKRILVALSTGCRDETETVSQEAAYKDAQQLLRAGELFHGTDEAVFVQMMCQRSRPHVRAIFDEYFKLTGHAFEKAVENEFSGNTRQALLALVHCIRDRSDFLAERLHGSMKGMGTDDRTLIRLVVSRSEKDLGEVKEVFERKFEKSLAAMIQDDTSGDYKKCLLSVVG